MPADPDVIYAVGDVHGCFDKLLKLEERIVRDAQRSPGIKILVMLGDYVDRGTDSASVVDHLSRPPPPGLYRICLAGNHDAEFLKFLEGRIAVEDWLAFGGRQTLESYGCDLYEHSRGLSVPVRRLMEEVRARIPADHRAFLQKLAICLTTPSFFFAHAGVRPGVPLGGQSETDLLWIRDEFLLSGDFFEKTIVHGHTPAADPVIAIGRIGVDTGAFMGGSLTAVRLSGGAVDFIAVR